MAVCCPVTSNHTVMTLRYLLLCGTCYLNAKVYSIYDNASFTGVAARTRFIYSLCQMVGMMCPTVGHDVVWFLEEAGLLSSLWYFLICNYNLKNMEASEQDT